MWNTQFRIQRPKNLVSQGASIPICKLYKLLQARIPQGTLYTPTKNKNMNPTSYTSPCKPRLHKEQEAIQALASQDSTRNRKLHKPLASQDSTRNLIYTKHEPYFIHKPLASQASTRNRKFCKKAAATVPWVVVTRGLASWDHKVHLRASRLGFRV